jgi:hypothetical protein
MYVDRSVLSGCFGGTPSSNDAIIGIVFLHSGEGALQPAQESRKAG